MQFAKKYKLDANTIEKDYVLNWLLDGIANSKTLNQKYEYIGACH